MEEETTKSMSKITAWIVLIIIVLILLIGGYFLFFQEEETNTNIATNENVNAISNTNTTSNTNSTTNTDTVVNMNTEIDTSDWLTYENEEYEFSIIFPNNWIALSEIDGSSISLDDLTKDRSSIIFSGFIIEVNENITEKNLDNYVDFYLKLYAAEQQYEFHDVSTKTNSGILAVVSDVYSIGEKINKFNYFFWNNGKPIYLGFTKQSDINMTVLNSLQLPDYQVDKSEWGTFNIIDLGFSIKTPKEMMGPAECHDFSSRTINGLLPYSVFTIDSSAYLAPEYFYVKDGGDCQRYETSASNIDKLELTYYWKFDSAIVNNESEIDSFIKEKYGSGCSFVRNEGTGELNEYNVVFKGDGKDLGVSDCPVNYMTVIKYSTSLNRIVAWNLGHGCWLSSKGGEAECSEILNSFKFIITN